MNDEFVEAEAPPSTLTPSSVQAGAMLREAREAQGLHIQALAAGLKVSVKKLEALEAGRLEELPTLVFARSLALTVCRSLKIDPTSIMASLPEAQASPFRRTEANLHTSFKDHGGGLRRGILAYVSTPIGLAVLALFVAIAVILAWPEVQAPFLEATAPSNAAEPAMAGDQQETLLPALTNSTVEPSGVFPALPAPRPLMGHAPVAGPFDAASIGSSVATKGSALPGQPAVLELTARGKSWVEVTDAAGVQQLRKTLTKGEVVQVAGQLPLKVRVAKADAVSVLVRGKPFDLAPLVQKNAARFEVN